MCAPNINLPNDTQITQMVEVLIVPGYCGMITTHIIIYRASMSNAYHFVKRQYDLVGLEWKLMEH